MTIAELNPKGNFDPWDESKLKEIRKGNFSEVIGKALFENDEIILWEIVLEPHERLPFRRHKNNFSCTSFTDVLALVRNVNGLISLIKMDKGDHYYAECTNQERIQDIENIGENVIKVAVVEEKTDTMVKAN